MHTGTHYINYISYAYANFAGLYFREFDKSTGICENENAYGTSLQLQAVIHKIKIQKIVRCGAFTKYTSRENLYTYGISNECNMHIEHKTKNDKLKLYIIFF